MYKIVRLFCSIHRDPEVIARGLTLEQAKAHCQNPETSSQTAKSAKAKRYTKQFGDWFDGFTKE